MKSGVRPLVAAIAFIAACPGIAGADDRSEYNQRAAALFMTLFQSLDHDRNRSITRSEAHGDLTFMPHFDDMDINRDGTVTLEELQRFVQLTFGIALARTDASLAPSTAHGKPGSPMK